MFRPVVAFAMCAALCLCAAAESRAARLSRAHAKLKESDPAAAIEILRELQVESPGDERVLYALGCAQYRLAEMQATGAPALPGAAPTGGLFDEAQATFGALSDARDPDIARHASFDRANCLAQSAKLAAQDPAKAQAAISDLVLAASAYEDYLRKYPDDRDARQNLDHVRFLLKVLKQQQKDDPQQQEQQKQEKNEQPKATLAVRNAQTEIPGATAVIGDEGVIQLQRPAATGGTP